MRHIWKNGDYEVEFSNPRLDGGDATFGKEIETVTFAGINDFYTGSRLGDMPHWYFQSDCFGVGSKSKSAFEPFIRAFIDWHRQSYYMPLDPVFIRLLEDTRETINKSRYVPDPVAEARSRATVMALAWACGRGTPPGLVARRDGSDSDGGDYYEFGRGPR